MKKTVSVNIRGINFMIEEDAYELLQDYLDRLTQTLKNETGSREILEDVELRIAEICSEKLSESKTVIELADIEQILANLGDPKDYVDEEENENSDEKKVYSEENQKSDRRLFRDTDNATIAGVAAGIANFFNIDVVIVRAIFVVMFLFGGFGFPLYIILWIIVPKAKSTIDKLRMKGRPITVETVREEVENAADNITKESKRFAKNIDKDDSYKRSVSRGARVLASILGIGLVGIGLLMLIPFLIFIIGGFEFIPVQGDAGFLSFPEFGELILSSSGDYSMMWIGGMLLGFSSILFVLLLGSMLIFKLKNIFTKLSLLGLFLTAVTGLILCSVVGMNAGKDFTHGNKIKEALGDVSTKEISILPTFQKTEGDYEYSEVDGLRWLEVNENDITQYGIYFEYVKSDDSLFHINREISARAENRKKSKTRCENVKHNVSLNGDSIYVATHYKYPKGDKIRDQHVTIIVEIPEGGSVRFKDHIITLGSYNDEGILIEPMYEEEGYLRPSGKYRHDD